MSRTYNNRKKKEGRERKLEAEMEGKKREEEKREEQLGEYWAIGAKKPGRKEKEEEKKMSLAQRRKELKELYEREMDDL